MSDSYPNQELRTRLSRAGIPESQHSLESLVSFMPLDLNVQSFDRKDTDSIAEMVLYFVAKGQMKFAHHSEFHTHGGRLRPINTLIDQWEQIVPIANSSAGFRASGSMAWIKDEQDMAEFAAYEDKVHMVINNSRITAI